MTNDTPFQREYADHLLHEMLGGRMTRRQLLVRASVVGLSATLVGQVLAACGSSSAVEHRPRLDRPQGGRHAQGHHALADRRGRTDHHVRQRLDRHRPAGGRVLIWVNNDLSLRPVLAESWSPNSDATVWTFKLRQGVTFQDGKPFGADDVVFTMNILLNPKTVSAALASFQGILSRAACRRSTTPRWPSIWTSPSPTSPISWPRPTTTA